MRRLPILLVLGLCLPPAVATADPWEELAFLPWGDGPGEVGLTDAREDELQYGPHGIAVSPGGQVAVVDRVNGRALVLVDDGPVWEEVALTGRPGPAALLPGGMLVVADEQDERRVKFVGTAEPLRTPRWTLPPNRLVTFTDDAGQTRVEGLNGFQLRLPVTREPLSPHELARGVPVAGGEAGVYVVRRDDELWVEFPERRVVLDLAVWPAGAAGEYGPGAVSVLAARRDSAVVQLESVYGGVGPIRVERAVRTVHESGEVGPPLPVAGMGPVVIPSDLAALPDGRVYQLVSTPHGCRLLRASAPEGSR